MEVRLQKVIAEAGLASRRHAEIWIQEGAVKVNGKVVTKLGTKVDPLQDRIEVRGQPLPHQQECVYYVFNKPANVMVTAHDPQGRTTIFDYLTGIKERVYPVGRLDFDSEGLLILTNDGALANQLTHPRHEIPKTYHVKIGGHLTEQQLKTLREGTPLEDGTVEPAKVTVLRKNPNNSWIEITIHEGKNRQVRRMVEAVGHKAIRLVRIAVGPLHLGKLKKGQFRPMTKREYQNCLTVTR